MRVISGKFKKKKLFLPNPKITRPLRDYVKESIFNLLEHSKLINFKLAQSKILDIFSGSGSFGIECISRGCSHVTFLEKEKEIINILYKNIKNLTIENKYEIIERDILKIDMSKLAEKKFDLLFLDPPFKYIFLNKLFEKLSTNYESLSESLILVHYENTNDYSFDKFLSILIKKNYGRSRVIFGKIKK